MTQNKLWGYQPATFDVSLMSAEKPVVAKGEVLVKNRAIGINPVDWKFIQADPLKWSHGHVPGVDGAGEIIEVGEGVDSSLIGRRVAYHAALALNGSFAEMTLLKAERLMLLPDSMSFEQAATLPCPMLTAWQAFEKIPTKAGRKVLVVGLGAVNKLLVQLLSKAGFVVDVVSRSLQQQQADALGINRIYRDTTEVDQTYFAAFDAAGSESAASLVPLLKANGHIVCILDRIPEPIDPPFTRTISYHEIALGALHDFGDSDDWGDLMAGGEALMSKIDSGEINVETPVSFDFEALPEALVHSEMSKIKTVVLTK